MDEDELQFQISLDVCNFYDGMVKASKLAGSALNGRA